MKAELWRAWLSHASALGIAPHSFWRLSLREWRVLVGSPASPSLDRATFEALGAQFPDQS